MGFGVSELLIILLIVALLFGTKKLRNMGGDLGSAVKSFKSAVNDSSDDSDSNDRVIEGKTEDAETSDKSSS